MGTTTPLIDVDPCGRTVRVEAVWLKTRVVKSTGSAANEYEVARVFLTNSGLALHYDANDFVFVTKSGRHINPLTEGATRKFGSPLGIGTAHDGNAIQGVIAFEAPQGGGTIQLTVGGRVLGSWPVQS
jgi:hypothetical protein